MAAPPRPSPATRPLPRRDPPVGSEKYEAILAAAEARFGAQGFRKAGIGEIARLAGVSKPLVYRYFRSKQHLFEVVADRVVDAWCDAIAAEGARVTPSAAHSLRLVIGASLDFARRRDLLRGLLGRESQLMFAGYGDVLDRGTRTLHGVVREVLERGLQSGDVRSDLEPDRMADVISEICVRFVDPLLAGDVEPVAPGLLDAIVETLLHGVIVARTGARSDRDRRDEKP